MEKQSKILIDNIGLEIELWYLWGDCKNKSTFMGVQYASKGGMHITNAFWFKTSISQEYYNNQVEFNIPWTKNKTAMIKNKLAALCKKLPEGMFTVSCQWPAYVGTHIHYSFKYKWGVVDFPIKHKTMFLFRNLLLFYIDYFSKKISTAKHPVEFNTLYNELERLIKNHNILINFDTTELDKYIESFLRFKDNNFIYTNNRSNKKYRPIIRSEPRPGKPLTLEIRYISNLVGLDQENLYKLNKMVEETINCKNDFKGNIWGKILRNQVKVLYKKLYWLYESIRSKSSTNNGWLMTINQYQDWLSWNLIKHYKWKPVTIRSPKQEDRFFKLGEKYLCGKYIYSTHLTKEGDEEAFKKWLEKEVKSPVFKMPIPKDKITDEQTLLLNFGSHVEFKGKEANKIKYYDHVRSENKSVIVEINNARMGIWPEVDTRANVGSTHDRWQCHITTPFSSFRTFLSIPYLVNLWPRPTDLINWITPRMVEHIEEFVIAEQRENGDHPDSIVFKLNLEGVDTNREPTFTVHVNRLRQGNISLSDFYQENAALAENIVEYLKNQEYWPSGYLEETVKNFFKFVYYVVKYPQQIIVA